ncbi:hypothetical protein KKC1_33990 [Calderihabitans maritimus]|uniref:Uncharacterized protein n=1 Tax=Calderihabitans maritimus TaxID=1246530 RepID=A0A1Z5HYC6_9FIRM|nr:hypothetical protein KKC1_33990 [Calderihabitans maritimus]
MGSHAVVKGEEPGGGKLVLASRSFSLGENRLGTWEGVI